MTANTMGSKRKPKARIDRLPDFWAAANAQGRAQAHALIIVIRTHQAPHLLGHAVKRMIKAGRYAGHQVGFFHVIGEACLDDQQAGDAKPN